MVLLFMQLTAIKAYRHTHRQQPNFVLEQRKCYHRHKEDKRSSFMITTELFFHTKGINELCYYSC